MTPPIFLGLDIGTTNTKCAAFAVDGTLIAEASEPVPLHARGDGWVEQLPDDYLTAAERTLRRSVEAGAEAGRVAGIGLTGQMGSMVALDLRGQPVFPSDLQVDSRCAPIRDAMLARHGDVILEANGIFPYTAPKLRWWQEQQPTLFRRIRRVVMPHAYVGMWLAGLSVSEAFMDRTCIGLTGVSDVRAAAWSNALCDLWEVDGDLLPRIVPPTEVVGGLTANAANACGLRAGTPVVAGSGDAVAGWLGAGAVDPGIAVDTSGSANHFALTLDALVPDLHRRILVSYPSAVPGRWHLLGYNSSSGLVHQWFVHEFATSAVESPHVEPDALYAALDTAAEAVPPGSEGLLFLPHLGGRVCPPEPEMRGAWVAFDWRHHREHFYRALLESIAYEYAFYLQAARELQPGLEPTAVRSIGGGARSTLWTRIRANVLGLDYLRLPGSNHGCLGAALLAAQAVGHIDDVAEIARGLARPVERIIADAEQHARYQPAVERYLRLTEDIRPLFRNLQDAGDSGAAEAPG